MVIYINPNTYLGKQLLWEQLDHATEETSSEVRFPSLDTALTCKIPLGVKKCFVSCQ